MEGRAAEEEDRDFAFVSHNISFHFPVVTRCCIILLDVEVGSRKIERITFRDNSTLM